MRFNMFTINAISSSCFVGSFNKAKISEYLGTKKSLTWLLLCVLMSGCIDTSSDNESNEVVSDPPPSLSVGAVPTLEYTQVKGFTFTWTDVVGASVYKILENENGSSGFSQIGSDLAQGVGTYTHVVPLHKRVNAQYILQSCNSERCVDAAMIQVAGNLVASIGYFKAHNPTAGDEFGVDVSISGDGNTLAVGAFKEDSSEMGVAASGGNDDAVDSGAVYVFSRQGASWIQQAFIKASNGDAGDEFGGSVSLSADGNTLAVGAIKEDSDHLGTSGTGNNDVLTNSGAVYVFNRSGSTWAQQAFVKANNNGENDHFGIAVSLSADGNTLAVGADQESSADVPEDNVKDKAGAVYVYIRANDNWSSSKFIKADNADRDDHFGFALSLSGDGQTLAVGAYGEQSNSTEIDGDEHNNSLDGVGAAYVFSRSNEDWTQQVYIKASNAEEMDNFGVSVSLSNNGDMLAVGADYENSNDRGVGGAGDNNTANNAGAAYVFARVSGIWQQNTYIKASNTAEDDNFGNSVKISGDGNTLVVSAPFEESNEVGVGGTGEDDLASASGAVYVFTLAAGNWTQKSYIKSRHTDADDEFGNSISVSDDGDTLAVGTKMDDSNEVGVQGLGDDNSLQNSGAVSLY